MTKQIRQFGAWSSPVTPLSLAGRLRLRDVQWDDDGETLVWVEGRGKRGVAVAQTGVDGPRDLNDLSAEGGLGYGGGEFTVGHGNLYFASRGRLYRQPLAAGAPEPITPAFGDVASPVLSPDGLWLAYVSSYENTDVIALVDSAGAHWPRKLAFGADFVMQPTWHPSGTRIAYVAWNFPQMPWDGAELRLATLDYDGAGGPYLVSMETVAGDAQTAIFQPEFSPDGRMLSYVSDVTGWGQLYLYDLAEKKHIQLTEGEGDFGSLAWVQGLRTYGWTHDSRALYAVRADRGFFSLWRVDARARKASRVEGLSDYTCLNQIAVSPLRDEVALIAQSSVIPERLLTLRLDQPDAPRRIAAEPTSPPSIAVLVDDLPQVWIRRRTGVENIAPAQFSQPRTVDWRGHDGETVYGLFYPPTSEQFDGPGKPPLMVHAHGGPTSQASTDFFGGAQFYATRGFAVLEVHYRGTAGYGRAYRDKLLGAWGIYDVEDCATGAAAMAAQGLVDPDRRVIWGSSAGGFTVLQSLIEKPGFYTAGICLYGVSNQFGLAADTHKFESRYLDTMLGPLPEAAAIYRERSPVFHADKILDPVIILQGADDKVVPRAQSDTIVAALKARGVPHEYHLYEGEGHGWRKPETIEAYYKSVLAFLKQYVLYA